MFAKKSLIRSVSYADRIPEIDLHAPGRNKTVGAGRNLSITTAAKSPSNPAFQSLASRKPLSL
jgi:hypothetical protein